jgi:hypothetical protein
MRIGGFRALFVVVTSAECEKLCEAERLFSGSVEPAVTGSTLPRSGNRAYAGGDSTIRRSRRLSRGQLNRILALKTPVWEDLLWVWWERVPMIHYGYVFFLWLMR